MHFDFENTNRSYKILVANFIDVLFFSFTMWLSASMLSEKILNVNLSLLKVIFITLIIVCPILWFVGFYKSIFRYAGIDSFFRLFLSQVIYLPITYFTFYFINSNLFSLNLLIMQSMLFLILSLLLRLLINYFFINYINHKNVKSVMIYGAGMAGKQIAAALQFNKNYKVCGLFDDDKKIHGLTINGWKVYDPKKLKKIIKDLGVTDIILAIPSLSNFDRHKVLKKFIDLKIIVKTIPDLSKILSGQRNVTDIIDLNIADLLVRDLVQPTKGLLKKAVYKKIIIVTGAGGSIGSEICRQLIIYNPKKLILIDISEAAIYKIENELKINLSKNRINNNKIISIIGSVCNALRMNDIMETFKPDTIYHCAAYKHVPLVETNCLEGVSNNIFGTINIAKIALKNKIKNFIFISTDKAVRPTNIMGATKRVSEIYLQALDEKLRLEKKINTKFSIVRFGNVLNSSGSVVPLFKKQIEDGGPITLTHKDVERYFMTIAEASQLVIQSTTLAKGGEVFVLGMGKRVKIYDLALKMIHLSGLTLKDVNNPNGDILIKCTGLRPGEKMYEELLINNNSKSTTHRKIQKGYEGFIKWKELTKKINKLEKHLQNNDIANVIKCLEQMVEGYKPFKEIIDVAYVEKL